MTDSPPQRQPRTRHSFRSAIREVIRVRLAKGDTLTVRSILKDAGGGSITTVQEEIAALGVKEKVRASALIGAGAKTVQARVEALEAAIDDALERERSLAAEVQAFREALAHKEAEVQTLLATHTDSQRMLLQGVDDLRQMVRAGRESLPPGVLAAERTKIAAEKDGDSKVIYWQTKHDQLLGKYVEMEKKNRAMASRLHELGENF